MSQAQVVATQELPYFPAGTSKVVQIRNINLLNAAYEFRSPIAKDDQKDPIRIDIVGLNQVKCNCFTFTDLQNGQFLLSASADKLKDGVSNGKFEL